MSTAHEPAFGEDGMPRDRYRLYHVHAAIYDGMRLRKDL